LTGHTSLPTTCSNDSI